MQFTKLLLKFLVIRTRFQSVIFIICDKRNKQKQPSRGVHMKSCSENIQPICRRTPMPKCNFNKVSCNFVEITFQHGCSLVNRLYILRKYLFLRTPLEDYFWMKQCALEIISTKAFWQVMHLETWCTLRGHIVCDFKYKLRSSRFYRTPKCLHFGVIWVSIFPQIVWIRTRPSWHLHVQS